MDMPQTMGPIFQQRISKRTAVSYQFYQKNFYSDQGFRLLYVSYDTHYVAGEVWQCDQLLAEPVVHQESGQHHVQVKEVGAGADQVCDNLQQHFLILKTSSAFVLTVCLPGGLDRWNLLSRLQVRLMASTQAVTRVKLTKGTSIVTNAMSLESRELRDSSQGP